LDIKTKISIEEQEIEDQDIMINTCPNNFVPKFSILMPVHNEDDSITNVVMDVHNKLAKNPHFTFEIILAEDGSNDNTKQVIVELSKKIPLKAILSYKRKGYAGGIKEGLKVVSSPYVLVSDSDGQHKPEDFWKLKKKLDELEHPEYVIVSGNRITRADPFHRQIISKTFQKLNYIMFDLSPMEDITSPFKLMHSNLAKSIASECKFMRESFWTEFIVRAFYMKIRIVEVPVQHSNRVRGESVVYRKSNIPKIVINQLNAVLHLKQELTGEGLINSILKTRFIK
jgi:glycosyltransferase involved in cell wall biosynthesis